MFNRLKKSPPQEPDCPVISLDACYAKTYDGKLGLTVLEHCEVTRAVCGELVRRILEAGGLAYPADAEMAAGAHDVGKISPWFAVMLHKAVGLSSLIAELDHFVKDNHFAIAAHNHASISYAALNSFAQDCQMAEAVGNHHGRGFCIDKTDMDVCYGGRAWSDLRQQFLARMCGSCKWSDGLPKDLVRAITGLVMLSDWIASGHFADPALPRDDAAVRAAVDNAGFVWPRIIPGLSFAGIFGFEPRQAQTAFHEVVTGPGVYFMEATMGMGKTEAALYAAYKMLESGKASGIYFALPTRLTSDRIKLRMDKFLARILVDPVRSVAVHGKAWLGRFLDLEMGGEDSGEEDDASVGRNWFSSPKRAIMAPYGVGTVDQALRSVINCRFSQIRTFGLAGKVIIIDECHSYDCYATALIQRLVRQLAGLGCTVLILSATLTGRMRAEIAGQNEVIEEDGYPLISAIPASGQYLGRPLDPGQHKRVWIRMAECGSPLADPLDHGLLSVMDLIMEHHERGEMVIWLENTVAEAQAIFSAISARLGDSNTCGLIHSRFTPHDRHLLEREYVSLYEPGAKGRGGKKGFVLVGTQILEQSLDLDTDLMVMRFAPTDMMIQRLGRLWRHESTPRPAGAAREAIILAPASAHVAKDPGKAFGRSGHIYDPYVLCRSYEVWSGRDDVLLPADIRPLLEATYREREENEVWAGLKKELQDKVRRLTTLADSASSLLSSEPMPDADVKTRAGEQDQIQLLLCKEIDQDNQRLVFVDGSSLGLAESRKMRQAEIAAMFEKNMVTISGTYRGYFDKPLDFVTKMYKTRMRTAVVQGEKPLLNNDLAVAGRDMEFVYSRKIGFQARKRGCIPD